MERISVAITSWLDSLARRGRSAATVSTYRQELERFRERLLMVGSDLDREPVMLAYAVELWCGRQLLDQRPPGVATYQRRLYILSNFYKYAVEAGILAFDPCLRVAHTPLVVATTSVVYI